MGLHNFYFCDILYIVNETKIELRNSTHCTAVSYWNKGVSPCFDVIVSYHKGDTL